MRKKKVIRLACRLKAPVVRIASADFRRDVLDYGVRASTSYLNCTEKASGIGRKAIRPMKGQLLTQKIMKKHLVWAKKYRS